MRDEAEVIRRTKELMDDLKRQFVKKRLSRACVTCSHNKRCVQRNVDFRYCNLKTEVGDDTKIRRLFVCDTDEWAMNCPDFKHGCDKAQAENEFNEIVRSPSRCGQVFPHLAALLWTLNDPHSAHSPQPKNETWFQRLRNKF